MKGILLAGGLGTRLYPLTVVVSKQLLPVYDKPMIYYPLSVLMLSSIRDILVITTPDAEPHLRKLLSDGSQWGVKFSYIVQERPKGIAEAFILGEDFIEGNPVCLILGDNILFGQGLTDQLREATQLKSGALIFGYRVRNPQQYGTVEFNSIGDVVAVEEKPHVPRSHYAIPGIYFYDHQVAQIAKDLQPSVRGELEITDVNKVYLELDQLKAKKLGRGVAWLDAGTPDSLLQASNFIQALHERQGLSVACLEEIAYNQKFIGRDQLKISLSLIKNNTYREYLESLLSEGDLLIAE